MALHPDAEGRVSAAVGPVRVDGDGWRAPPDWRAALLDCAGAGPDQSCAYAEGWRPTGERPVVEVGGARLALEGGGVTRWEIAWAGAAWGALARPTGFTDADPDLEPDCD